MCECLHRARASKISLKNVASTPTFSLSIGKSCGKSALSLSATIFQYVIGGMMPESANPVQQNLTVIEIRPFKGGWQCYEGPGVGPYWIGDTAKEDAIGYATARAKFGRGEIRVLDNAGQMERVISFDHTEKS
jgi:hypothetical protein